MSLTSILSTATSALLTAQYQTAVASDNISNASTAGATQKTYTTTTSASLTSSLSEGEVTRLTDAYLSKTNNSTASDNGSASTISSYLQSYDSALGSTTDGDDISSLLTSFQTALATLAASPSSASDKTSVIDAASTLANGISGLSDTIQSLRTQASSDIATTVSTINSDLSSLATLNSQIAAGTAAGTDVTSLEDQRDSTLTDLSSQVGVQYYTDSNNQLVVYDSGGDQLLGANGAATLSYSAGGALGAASTYPGSISGITLNGKDVTSNLTSGTLGGLVQLRDDVLPEQQDELDQLASSLISTTNAVTNAGTSDPAPSSLTSDTTVASSDSFSATGTVRIAVTDSSGDVVSSTDLDLSQYASVSDLLAGLNGISGVSASIDSSGKLVIAASSSSDGIAIGASTSDVGGESFSSYFGFNDLFSGDDASTIAVSASLSADASTLPTGALSTASTLSAGDTALTVGDSTTLTALETALSATRTLSASGTASAQTTTLVSAASSFVSQAATTISDASSAATTADSTYTAAQNALSNATGISVDQQTALLTEYQNQYEAASQLMTTVKSMYSTLISMMES